MKSHRLNLREAALPALELELMDGTVIHVLPGSPSQLQELKTIQEKLLKEGEKDTTDTETYLRLTFEFLSEILSRNKEGLYFTANDLKNKYLKIETDPTSTDPKADAQQNQLLVISAVFSEYVSFLYDIKGSKNL